MTLNGAIMQLVEMRENSMMPEVFKPYFDKVIETVSECEEPSAQTEIIHCRDCKHRGEKPIADGRYWCEIHDTFMYYCSDAERRTDDGE